MLYDLFFVPPKKPPVGDDKEDCIAVAPIRNSAGNIIRWHALCTKEQWEYHRANGGKGFYAERSFVGRSVNSIDETGKPIVKTAPVHSFLDLPVYDGDTDTSYQDETRADRKSVSLPPEVKDVV